MVGIALVGLAFGVGLALCDFIARWDEAVCGGDE